MLTAHLLLATIVQTPEAVWSPGEVASALIRPLVGLVAGFVVFRIVRQVPWPRPFRVRFLLVHAVAAPLLALAWGVASNVLVAVAVGDSPSETAGRMWEASLFGGVFLYALLAGVFYAFEGNARAARAESAAARTQLAALRAQVHPHFLFNALHAVVQLIPVEPARAAEAAELVSELLRTALEEQRDEVPLADEWQFVSRYLAVERIRFGDRLVVRNEIGERLLGERVPAFALQTLAENAVQHGAAHRIAPTEIVITATGSAGALTLVVHNSGEAGSTPAASAGTGTGLLRLRERLQALYGGAARLECGPSAHGGFTSTLTVPRQRVAAA